MSIKKIQLLTEMAVGILESTKDEPVPSIGIDLYNAAVCMSQSAKNTDFENIRLYADRIYDHWANGCPVDKDLDFVMTSLSKLIF